MNLFKGGPKGYEAVGTCLCPPLVEPEEWKQNRRKGYKPLYILQEDKNWRQYSEDSVRMYKKGVWENYQCDDPTCGIMVIHPHSGIVPGVNYKI